MERISNTLKMARASWQVLRADKELMALPVISAIASLIAAATFVVPLFVVGGASEEPGPLQYVVLFVMYVVLAYITIFFNAALIHAANERLSGGDPTLGSALRGAGSRAGAIFPWAVISATVSIILKSLEDRAGFVGQLVISLVGLAWSLTTFLVLPVLVMENIGVVEAIKKSGRLFKQTWGENVAAQIGFGLIGFAVFLVAGAIAVAGIAVGGAIAGVAIAAAIVLVVVSVVVLAALNGIFQTALYHYATAGAGSTTFFDTNLLSNAFRPRR